MYGPVRTVVWADGGGDPTSDPITLARFSTELAELFSTLGVQAAIGFIRNTLTGPWLDPQAIEQRLNRPFRLRLV